MRPQQQITPEEYRAAREELRSIDARPIKKVMEAKLRKRKRLQQRLTVARQKAEAISNQEDVPLRQKMREIEKLYSQAKAGKGAKGRGGKKASRSEQYKQKGPRLDSRMKKDKRGAEKAAKRGKGKKGAPPVKGGKAGKNRRR
jgi:AdoMet-dependent rRNA methyltransferase SPB1